MKFINVCGYGNTGCTSQVDVLCDYEGVFGVLSPLHQTIKGKSAYHEIGVLKCIYSLGGIIITKLNKSASMPSREEIHKSLIGQLPSDKIKPLGFGAQLHLEMRELLTKHYGQNYFDIVNDAMSELPKTFNDMTIESLIPKIKSAMEKWMNGLALLIQNTPALRYRNGEEVTILGLKNDPPGSYPLLASFIPKGLTSAILRDPRDTTFDFNRHYKLGQSDQTVRNHCIHYNAQINSARSQLERFSDIISDSYFVHDFENLIQSEKHRSGYIKKMIGNRPKIRQHFNPIESSKNIGHYVNLSEDHIKYITDNCLDNYQRYRDFLEKKGFLMI